MRCLYCGKQLALFRRITGGGEFCSEAHKHSYHEEYNRLALNRLLQAQSKPDETKPPALKAAGPAQPRASIQPREPEPSWTAAPRTEQKGLSASIEPPGPRPMTAPRQAGFIVEAPQTRMPAKIETVPSTAAQVLRSIQIHRPISARPETTFVLASTGLLKLAKGPTARGGTGQLKTPVVADVCRLSNPLSTPFLELVTCNPGFEPADLVELDVQPMAPAVAAAALDAPIEFMFSSDLEQDAVRMNECSVEIDEVPLQTVSPLLQDFVQIKTRAIAPSKLGIPVPEDRLIATLELALPVHDPLPLRPRPAIGDSRNTREVHVKAKLGLVFEKPAQQEAKAQPGQPDSKESPTTDGISDDLPPFLRDHEDKSAKKWGSFHKYLKNLVGCLVVASLCGIAGSKFQEATFSVAAAASSEKSSGEADRSRLEHRMFVYPESRPRVDHRVEFEASAASKGSIESVRFTDLASLTHSPSGRSA